MTATSVAHENSESPMDWTAWTNADDDARQSFARSIDIRVDDFEFVGLATHGLANVKHRVAIFRGLVDGTKQPFVLIPRGEAMVGFDVERLRSDYVSDAELSAMIESFDVSRDEYEIEEDFFDYVSARTTDRRRVAWPTMLVQSGFDEPMWENGDIESDVFKPLVDAFQDNTNSHVCSTSREIDGEQWEYRVRRVDSSLVAEQYNASIDFERSLRSRDSRFRLPSWDEWEFLCGVGAETLFRWGDEAPMDRYPTDLSPEEAEWRRRWVFSAGTLDPPKEPFRSDDTRHTRPNAIGLTFSGSPYRGEFVAGGRVRGGDGGCAICGGCGWFLGWFPLATAYSETFFCEPETPYGPDYTVFRRVLEL